MHVLLRVERNRVMSSEIDTQTKQAPAPIAPSANWVGAWYAALIVLDVFRPLQQPEASISPG